MAWTRLQAAGAKAGTTTVTATLPNPTTAGSLLVAWQVAHGDLSVADNSGVNTWAQAAQGGPVPGGVKTTRWGWCLSTRPITGLAITSTNTSSGNCWIQVAEYAPALPRVVNCELSGSLATTSANYTGAGTLTATLGGTVPAGSLVVAGVGTDTEGVETYTASTGLTTIVLDAASKTGGDASNAATMAFGENLNCGSSPQAAIAYNTTNGIWMDAIAFSFTPLDTLNLNMAPRRAATY